MKKINKTFLGFLVATGIATVAVTSFIKLNESKKNPLDLETKNSLFLNNQEQQNKKEIDLIFNQSQIFNFFQDVKLDFDNEGWKNLLDNKNIPFKLLSQSQVIEAEKIKLLINDITPDKAKLFWKYKFGDNEAIENKKTYFKGITSENHLTDQNYKILANQQNFQMWLNSFNFVTDFEIKEKNKNLEYLASRKLDDKANSLEIAEGNFHWHIADSLVPYPSETTSIILADKLSSASEFVKQKIHITKLNDNEMMISKKGGEIISNDKTYLDTKTNEKFDWTQKVQVFDLNNWIQISETPKKIRLNNEKIDFSDFFLIKPDFTNNYENDKPTFYFKEKPRIKIELNLPLLNGFIRYKNIPSEFVKTRLLMMKTNEIIANQPYLKNLLFGGEKKYFEFLNNWLVNLVNNFYDINEIKNIQKFLNDFNESKNREEFKNVVFKLLKEDIFLENGTKLPKNILKSEIDSVFQEIILKQIDSIKFLPTKHELETKIWNDSIFNNFNNFDFKWNIWTDIVLPNILGIDIFIDYEDEYGNEILGKKIYDGTKQQFIENAIMVAPSLPDKNFPYSKTKIKKILFGNIEQKKFLPKNIDIDNSEKFKMIVNKSIQYANLDEQKWSSYDYDNNKKTLKATKDGIEIKFRYLANKKEIEESAWWKLQNETNSEGRMLIPDEAWGDDVDRFDTTPNSSLEEILNDLKSKELFERAIARPFILKKTITTEDLRAGKRKYVETIEKTTTIFSKGNIGDIFLTKAFKDKYNSTSHTPWWTWTFKDLVQEEKDFQNQKLNAIEVIKKDYFQEEWFNNFIANKNLANKTLEDFFPKLDEGRFFVIGSYKPSIDSTQVKLTDEAGFYFAGEQYDDYQQISNFNYVVELEVKNKTYQANLANFNLSNVNYNGNVLAYDKYQELVQLLAKNSLEYFKISSNAFKANQIEEPTINLVLDNTTNSFEPQGLGKLVIDFQKSIPIVSQIGNEVVYQQLPFELDKLKGMDEFIKNYQKYIITSQVEYDALDKLVKQKKIFIDKINNQIIIGGAVIAQEQNFMVNGILSKSIFTIPSSYWDKSIATVGFEQKTKTYLSPENALKKYNLMSQDEIFKMLFSWNTKQQADVDLLKELVKKRNVKFSFELENDNLVCLYHWDDLEGNYFTSDVSMKVIDIRPIRLDLIDKNSFNYGYQRELDTDISFANLIWKIKDIKNFVDEHFNNLSNFEKENLINGIKNIKVLNANEKEKTVRIEIALKENYVLYNKEDSLILNLKLSEKIKFSIGEFKIQNIDKKIQRELFEQKEKENKIIYLNRLDLQTKISFFKKMNFQINFNINSNEHLIENIIFKFFKEDLIANFIFNNPDIVLDAKNKININNFENELETSLNIGNSTLKNKMMPLLIGGLGAFAISLMTGMTFIFIKRKKQKADFLKTEENRETTYSDKDLFK